MTPWLLPEITASVGDPGRTRTVYAAILFLVALGVVLAALAVWLIRSTRSDPEVLAPLEVLGERKFRKLDPVWQRRRLDEVRPEGAVPISPAAPLPAADASFDLGPPASGFDDLTIEELLSDPLLADPSAPEHLAANGAEPPDADGLTVVDDAAPLAAPEGLPVVEDHAPLVAPDADAADGRDPT